MKSILLKFNNEADFFKLQNLKTRYELILKESLTWEEFIMKIKINSERVIK